MCEQLPHCPRCQGTQWKCWEWPHWSPVLWTVIPIFAFNELVFGQRQPKRTLVCQSCEEPLMRRQWVPCPHCGALHDGMIWMQCNAFGNWLGYVCPTCRQRIPCLWNWTSLLVLALTAPLWWWPYRYYFRDRPASPPKPLAPVSKWGFWLVGLIWGLFMWCYMPGWSYGRDYFRSGQLPEMGEVLFTVVLWSVMGTLFGATLYWQSKRQFKKE